MSNFSPQVDGSPLLDEAPWNYIPALMLFPEQPAKRKELLNAMVAQGFKGVFLNGAFPGRFIMLDRLSAYMTAEYGGRWDPIVAEATAPAARGAKGASGSGHGGNLAGLTLLIPLITWRKDPTRKPNRGEAYRALTRLIASGGSKRTLQTNWMKFRSVAHLWAAFLLLDGFPKDALELSQFIALARQIRDEAGRYKPAREHEALLPFDVSIDLDAIDFGPIRKLRASPDWIDHVELQGHRAARD